MYDNKIFNFLNILTGRWFKRRRWFRLGGPVAFTGGHEPVAAPGHQRPPQFPAGAARQGFSQQKVQQFQHREPPVVGLSMNFIHSDRRRWSRGYQWNFYVKVPQISVEFYFILYQSIALETIYNFSFEFLTIGRKFGPQIYKKLIGESAIFCHHRTLSAFSGRTAPLIESDSKDFR